MRVTPGLHGARGAGQRVLLCQSIWKSRLWGPCLFSLCKCKRTGGITALVLSKQKACHLSPRFIDSVSPISSNGYHREWLGETWSHNEAQIITTSPKFARALSLSRSASPQLQARQTVCLFYKKGLDKREERHWKGKRSWSWRKEAEEWAWMLSLNKGEYLCPWNAGWGNKWFL